MDKWETFGKKVVEFVGSLDAKKITYLAYAMTYAQHILVNIDEGKNYNYSPEEATKTQMLYVISNLEGANEEEFKQIDKMCEEVGVDVKDAIQEMLEIEDE